MNACLLSVQGMAVLAECQNCYGLCAVKLGTAFLDQPARRRRADGVIKLITYNKTGISGHWTKQNSNAEQLFSILLTGPEIQTFDLNGVPYGVPDFFESQGDVEVQ